MTANMVPWKKKNDIRLISFYRERVVFVVLKRLEGISSRGR